MKERAFNARQFLYDLDPNVFNSKIVDPNFPENEINDAADEGDGRGNSPEGFFSHGAEILMQAVHDGPDGEKEKRHSQYKHGPDGF